MASEIKVNKFTGEFFDSTEGPVDARGQKFDEAYTAVSVIERCWM